MDLKLLFILSSILVVESFLFRPANNQHKPHLLKPSQHDERWKGKLQAYSPFKLDYHIPSSFGFKFPKPEVGHAAPYKNGGFKVEHHHIPKPELGKGLGFYSLDELKTKEKHTAKAHAHVPVYNSHSHHFDGFEDLRAESPLHHASFGTNFPVNAHLVQSHHKF